MEGREQDNLIDLNSIPALGRPTFASPLGILGIRSPRSKRHTVGNMHDSIGAVGFVTRHFMYCGEG